jgi:hypothetical protein
MSTRGDEPSVETGMSTIGGQIVLSRRVVQFRRLLRWFNLTMVHQGVWPLLLVLSVAPAGKPGELPTDWFFVRLAAPVVAVLMAFMYLRHQPPAARPGAPGDGPIARQVRVGLVMLALLLIGARLLAGPLDPALQLILFGVADVAAFHVIHFGVVRRTYLGVEPGLNRAVLLFGISWGLRDMLLTAFGPEAASPVAALVIGTLLGLAIASGARWMAVRLGSFWPGALAHFILIYLVIGFVE